MKLKALASVIVVIATVSAVGGSAMAFETPRELVRACRALEAGTRGKAERLDILFTRPALLCWGYFQAIQDFSVLADEGGNRLLGACPGEEGRLCN
jgi:hypothetical protein